MIKIKMSADKTVTITASTPAESIQLLNKLYPETSSVIEGTHFLDFQHQEALLKEEVPN